jgi:6-phosphogluconolactonase/glucosamine-6-phosphate isomerase/deaminase
LRSRSLRFRSLRRRGRATRNGRRSSPGRSTRALAAPIRAPGAAEARLTLTGRVILRARAIALHIEGEGKAARLAKALGGGPLEAMPIRAVLRQAGDRLTLFCAASS